jgi:Undecaprenyl-phosphate galactose phosphotransferase WbaP
MSATVGTLTTSRREARAVVACRGASLTATAAATLAADSLAVALAGGLAVLFWSLVNRSVHAESYLQLWPATFVFLAAYAMLGLYPGVGLSPVEELRRSVVGTSMVYLVGSASIVLARETGFSRGVFLGGWALAVICVPVFRSGLRHFCAARSWWGVPVLVLGAGAAGRTVVARLQATPGLGLKPVAFLDDDADKEPDYEGVPVAGPLAIAADLGRRLHIHYALVAMPSLKRQALLEVLERGGTAFSHLIVLPDLFGMASLWVSARDLGGVLGLEVRQNLLSPVNRAVKRGMDLVVGVAVGLLTLPLLAAAVIWIKRVSPGSAFYEQERGGEAGRTIRVHKLRTMHPDADALLDQHLERNPEARREWARYFKLRNDPRLLPGIGRLLRRTSLDELPQLWNVIKGEMSLVGPRPFPHYHLNQFTADFRSFRARVLPGLTGLWQVSARSDGDLAVQQSLDTYYIRNWSLWLDLHILARTVRAVLLRQGAC